MIRVRQVAEFQDANSESLLQTISCQFLNAMLQRFGYRLFAKAVEEKGLKGFAV
jgi:hypothetical protein